MGHNDRVWRSILPSTFRESDWTRKAKTPKWDSKEGYFLAWPASGKTLGLLPLLRGYTFRTNFGRRQYHILLAWFPGRKQKKLLPGKSRSFHKGPSESQTPMHSAFPSEREPISPHQCE